MVNEITKEGQQKILDALNKIIDIKTKNLQGLKNNIDAITYLMPQWNNYDSETHKSIQVVLNEMILDLAKPRIVPQHLLDEMQELTDSLK